MRLKNVMCEIEIGFIMNHYGYINNKPFQRWDKGCDFDACNWIVFVFKVFLFLYTTSSVPKSQRIRKIYRQYLLSSANYIKL